MYVSIDCETGGLGLDKSLLTASFIFYENGKFVTELLLRLKPNDGIYLVEARALGINQINLVEHDKLSVSYKEAGTYLYKILREYSKNGSDKLVVVGKNVHGDIAHIWDKLMSRGTWETFVSYRWVDISSVWKFLEDTGKVPTLPNTGLKDICQYFNMDMPDHTASKDAQLTFECYRRLCQL